MKSTIAHENAIEELKQAWKLELIEKGNPTWRGLYKAIVYLDSGFRESDAVGTHT